MPPLVGWASTRSGRPSTPSSPGAPPRPGDSARQPVQRRSSSRAAPRRIAAQAREGTQGHHRDEHPRAGGPRGPRAESSRLPRWAQGRRGAQRRQGARSTGTPTARSTAPPTIPQTDWYIAIDDEQQGPVTLEFIKKAWEEGRSLPTRSAGATATGTRFPLSTVADLVKVLTPIPVPRKSAISPLPPDAEKPARSDGHRLFRPRGRVARRRVRCPIPTPSTGSRCGLRPRLLVQDEIAALTKPTPKKTDEPVGAVKAPGPRAQRVARSAGRARSQQERAHRGAPARPDG